MDIDSGSLNIREMALKCKTKTEVYNTLTVVGHLYLPPKPDTNCDYISDILSGRKVALSGDEIRVVKVPHIKGLKVSDIVEWGTNYFDIDNYLPQYRIQRYPSRSWVCNVVATAVPKEFDDYIREKLDERDKSMIENRNMMIDIKPSFAKFFHDSNMYSRSKGRFHQLVKNSYSKRINRLEKERKEEEFTSLKKEFELQKEKIDELLIQVAEFEREADEKTEYGDKLNKLYHAGVIDTDGNPVEKDE